MKKIFTALTLIIASFEVSAQCNLFYDGFETGTFLPHWTLGPSNTQNVNTTTPAVGTYSLEHSGSSGHVGGSFATFTPGQPGYISYRIKSDGTTGAHGYVVIGDATVTANDCMLFSYVSGGNALRFYNGTGQNFPINTNQWYHVELQNINYTARTMDVYLDGNLVLPSWGFRSTTMSSIDRIHLYNLSAANAGYDEIIIGTAPAITNQSITICSGDSVTVANNTYNTTGNYSDTLQTVCLTDSIINTNLTVLAPLTSSVTSTICNTDSVVVNGTTYNASNPSGTEVFSNVGPNNCDSTVTINLNVLPALTGSVTNTICNTDSVVVNGTTYNASNPSGTEVFSNVGPNNCDSTVTINLNVLAPLTGSVTNTICNTDSIVVNGTTYNASNPSGTEVFSNVGPNNCDSTVTINLNVLPAIDVTVTNASPSLTSNENGATYQWLDCDNNFSIIAGATSQTFNASANGNYAVEVTVGNCVDTSACESVANVGINENGLFNGVSIFPNPTNNIINITLNAIDKANLTVYTIDGKVVYQNNNITEKQTTIDLSNNSKGIYFLKVEAKNQNKVYKIIKE